MESSAVSAGDWTKASHYNNLRDDAVPTGSVIMYPLNATTTGYLICNGQAVSRTTYANLFALIAEVYGAGDGVNTFNVPDLRDRFPFNDGILALGAVGDGTHIITEAQMPLHNHTIIEDSHAHSIGTTQGSIHGSYGSRIITASGNADHTLTSDGSHNHGGATGAQGTDTAINIVPNYFPICYLIKI
jgi:microcystin-dependent protein